MIKGARYMYKNNRGPTGKNLHQLKNNQAKVTEKECSYLV